MLTINTKNSGHYLLLVSFFLEIFELEAFITGVSHHIWDALIVALCAYAAGQLSKTRKASYTIFLLGGLAWLIDLADFQWERFNLESFFWVAMHAYLISVLGRRLFYVTEVTQFEIVDAVSLYIAAGIAFSNVYSLILWYLPDALIQGGVSSGLTISYDLVLYYSFITQATVGYGDMAPAHPLTRMVSVLQALFGVLYVAVLISRFVSIHSARHLMNRDSHNNLKF